MQSIVLAGGLGTRLRSLVSDVPKSMAPIHGVPFLEILVRRLVDLGARRVILAIGYLGQQVVAHFAGLNVGAELVFCREDVPLGTGGAVFSALQLCGSGEVFVLNGDTLVEFDPLRMSAARAASGAVLSMCLVHVPEVMRYGAVAAGPDGRIRAFSEKGARGPGAINAGVYNFEVGSLVPPGIAPPYSFERDVIAPLVRRGAVVRCDAAGGFIDIGVPEDYVAAQGLLAADAVRIRAARPAHPPA